MLFPRQLQQFFSTLVKGMAVFVMFFFAAQVCHAQTKPVLKQSMAPTANTARAALEILGAPSPVTSSSSRPRVWKGSACTLWLWPNRRRKAQAREISASPMMV